jgi:hypothetical protein
MHRQRQTQELAEAVLLLAHGGERFTTLVGVGTILATAGNGVARARRTVVHFFFIRVTGILRTSHPAAVALIIKLFSFLQSEPPSGDIY